MSKNLNVQEPRRQRDMGKAKLKFLEQRYKILSLEHNL